MSKPGGCHSSGISLGDALRLPKRHPAWRRREAQSGSRKKTHLLRPCRKLGRWNGDRSDFGRGPCTSSHICKCVEVNQLLQRAAERRRVIEIGPGRPSQVIEPRNEEIGMPKNAAYYRRGGGKNIPGAVPSFQNTSSASSGFCPCDGRAKRTAVIAPIETPAITSGAKLLSL